MLRKTISLLLVLGMLLVVAAGCAPSAAPMEPGGDAAGSEEMAPGEVVTLDYYWIGNGDTDQRELVQNAINEYVEPLIGVNVVFHIVGWGDWETKAVTALQAGEKIDIFFTADLAELHAACHPGAVSPVER